jgi:hypothetical protein
MRISDKTIVGWEGWNSTTPAWAAIASNYLMLATLGLFILSGFVEDWSEFIPDYKMEIIKSIFESVERSFVTIGTALRFLGVKPKPPVNENMYGIPHDNG